MGPLKFVALLVGLHFSATNAGPCKPSTTLSDTSITTTTESSAATSTAVCSSYGYAPSPPSTSVCGTFQGSVNDGVTNLILYTGIPFTTYCAAACGRYEGCVAFSYVNGANLCNLYSLSASTITSESNFGSARFYDQDCFVCNY
ncbi:hypothetical protein QQZ08_001466 [Neonectria magnoliae]|uniref:Apple domain-containing protein n=1 Tax=Neonectria magnoliae TaxID=2732573 RepID=A0ABR1IDZ9_9HYPO